MKVKTQTEQKIYLMKSLTDDLPVLRARLGLSQEELADRIGISRQTYGGIETKKREMNWTIFMALLVGRKLISYTNE